MNEETSSKRTNKSSDNTKENKKQRKPSYLKDRKTASGVTFGV